MHSILKFVFLEIQNKAIRLVLSGPVTYIYYVYKAEKPSVCPSVCLRHGIISGISAYIDLRLGLCIAEVFQMCMEGFQTFQDSSAGRWSTEETLMSSNLQCF